MYQIYLLEMRIKFFFCVLELEKPLKLESDIKKILNNDLEWKYLIHRASQHKLTPTFILEFKRI